ncbi:hypothetical protein PAPYR_4428 [Paratrimastix pyriformis]|uniref:Uncharacterized protein n=1 Tax=Paratrimastix pyriformis TaxID=342808 RepID=A0ABQ8USF7_9EUKA|nr:hypothetical protein PAPYR_4428 [Paratrimastix pyriformis]
MQTLPIQIDQSGEQLLGVLRAHTNSPIETENRAEAAFYIQHAWRRYWNRKVFHRLKEIIKRAEEASTSDLIKKLNPGSEAAICSDPTMNSCLRFRFSGEFFPPMIVFKIVSRSTAIQYLSGINLITPMNQAGRDAARTMGIARFNEIMLEREAALSREKPFYTDEKEYLRYLRDLDERPVHYGGRGNTWRPVHMQVESGSFYLALSKTAMIPLSLDSFEETVDRVSYSRSLTLTAHSSILGKTKRDEPTIPTPTKPPGARHWVNAAFQFKDHTSPTPLPGAPGGTATRGSITRSVAGSAGGTLRKPSVLRERQRHLLDMLRTLQAGELLNWGADDGQPAEMETIAHPPPSAEAGAGLLEQPPPRVSESALEGGFSGAGRISPEESDRWPDVPNNSPTNPATYRTEATGTFSGLQQQLLGPAAQLSPSPNGTATTTFTAAGYLPSVTPLLAPPPEPSTPTSPILPAVIVPQPSLDPLAQQPSPRVEAGPEGGGSVLSVVAAQLGAAAATPEAKPPPALRPGAAQLDDDEILEQGQQLSLWATQLGAG